MILFYNKKNGNVFAVIEGRVHNSEHLNCSVFSTNNKKDNLEKLIIGFVKDDKGKTKVYNRNMFELLDKFESNDKTENPLFYRYKHGRFVKKKRGKVKRKKIIRKLSKK